MISIVTLLRFFRVPLFPVYPPKTSHKQACYAVGKTTDYELYCRDAGILLDIDPLFFATILPEKTRKQVQKLQL